MRCEEVLRKKTVGAASARAVALAADTALMRDARLVCLFDTLKY
jgi:hypothetical protein